LSDRLTEFGWLPVSPSWGEQLKAARDLPPADAARQFMALANCQLDFLQTGKLDRAVQQMAPAVRAHIASAPPVRLALLASCTVSQLIPGIRIGGLRRGLWIDVYEAPYGTYRQEIEDPASGLAQFKPDVVLLSLDAQHLVGGEQADAAQALDELRPLWASARKNFNCAVIQQTALPVFMPILGNNEHRYASSKMTLLSHFNAGLRDTAAASKIQLLSLDAFAALDGLSHWYDEALWHRAKQEIHPRVAHVYGDQVGRVLAAIRGRSAKCLVLDLDNTLWGGVIGDDGMAGIAIGQGSATGEAHLALQRYAKQLAQRGIILAVCSKNDEANALEVFEKHPEMLLRTQDIACFVANWNDKASNLREIARRLNIGTDARVFVDDNPFERNLIRQELPEVAVPELPEDPALYASCVAAAGYFEGLTITAEDQERTSQYRANVQREQLRESTTDMASYLDGLKMELRWAPFDKIGLARVAQLINKTNQFNLTTRRYTEDQVSALLQDPAKVHAQFRLLDRFGDNGIIGLIIGELRDGAVHVDTWLMSCRVLGRQVEAAMLNVLTAQSRQRGADALVGYYRPSAKNGMVREHYPKLGFAAAGEQDGATVWRLELAGHQDNPVSMSIIQGP
jgi:FkbH-like protein